jgi:hypothetical protein
MLFPGGFPWSRSLLHDVAAVMGILAALFMFGRYFYNNRQAIRHALIHYHLFLIVIQTIVSMPLIIDARLSSVGGFEFIGLPIDVGIGTWFALAITMTLLAIFVHRNPELVIELYGKKDRSSSANNKSN